MFVNCEIFHFELWKPDHDYDDDDHNGDEADADITEAVSITDLVSIAKDGARWIYMEQEYVSGF